MLFKSHGFFLVANSLMLQNFAHEKYFLLCSYSYQPKCMNPYIIRLPNLIRKPEMKLYFGIYHSTIQYFKVIGLSVL